MSAPNSTLRRRHTPELDPHNPPPRLTRRDAARVLYAQLGYVISPRTLEGWALPRRLVAGRATYDTVALLAFAQAKVDASATQQGGRSRT